MLVVTGRPLQPGEELSVTYGDRSGGGPGSRAQTFAEARRYFWVDVGREGRRASSLPCPIRRRSPSSGARPTRLVVVVPSDVVAARPSGVVVNAEDEWGNPAAAYRGRVQPVRAGVDRARDRSDLHRGRRRGSGAGGLDRRRAGRPPPWRGRHGAWPGGGEQPPRRTGRHPAHRLYWGDPHGGQMVDAGKIPDFFRYARDVAGIDFAGYQRNDHVHSRGIRHPAALERELYAPGRFVPLPGFEWSGDLAVGRAPQRLLPAIRPADPPLQPRRT